jgi:ElaB/YqjD/DUF883 family membrane-anchored ribosome-binding protein
MQAKEALKGNSSGAQAEQKAAHMAGMMSKEFKNFLTDIEKMINKSGSLTGEDLEHARREISERVTEAKELLEENSETVVRKARKTIVLANGYIHSHPWSAVGVTLAAGAVCGFLLMRRK